MWSVSMSALSTLSTTKNNNMLLSGRVFITSNGSQPASACALCDKKIELYASKVSPPASACALCDKKIVSEHIEHMHDA